DGNGNGGGGGGRDAANEPKFKVLKFTRYLLQWGLLPILRWTSIGKTQDEKTLKKLQNSIGRTGSSIDTTRNSIGRMYSSKKGNFGLGLLSIPWFDLPNEKDLYRYKFPSTDTMKLQTAFNADFYSCNDSILFITATNVHKVVRGLKY
ncbi:hypothetical protein Goari_000660, partial [Gossypium aridum]|nr:hypothetical protein [Gossypium aridum]